MKSKSLYLIAFLFVGATSIFAQNIQFKEYKDESYHLERVGGDVSYEEFITDITWPIGGLPADKLHSLRLCLLDAFASKEVASKLSAKVDDANFPATLHKVMRGWNGGLTNRRDIPQSAHCIYGEQLSMDFDGAHNGVVTFSIYVTYATNAHILTWSLNYDVERNLLLELGDILLMDKEEEVNRIYRDVVNQYLRENVYGAGELDTDIDFDDLGGWYVSSDGIVFVFNPEDMRIGTCQADGIVEVTLPLSKYKHIFRPEALKYWANCVESSILLSSELDAANEHISQVVQQHNEIINRSPYTQYLNTGERNRFMPTDFPFQIPKAYDYDQAKAFCDSLQRVADSQSQQDPMTTVTSIKDYLRATRPDDFVKAYLKENPTAKAHLESEHKEYRCHYASFTDFVLQYEQGRLQPTERNCRELKWQEYKPYYNNKKAFDADYDKGDAHLEAHKKRELKWREYGQYYSDREAFDVDYNKGDNYLEAHKKREIKWAECADYYASRNLFDKDYNRGETVVDAYRASIDDAWASLQKLPEKTLVKKNLKGARDSKKVELFYLFSLYRQLKPSPHFQSLAADFLISRNKKMGKEYKKKGSSFSSKIEFVNAYFADYYKLEAEEDKRVQREIKRIERKRELAAKRANHEQQRQEQKTVVTTHSWNTVKDTDASASTSSSSALDNPYFENNGRVQFTWFGLDGYVGTSTGGVISILDWRFTYLEISPLAVGFNYIPEYAANLNWPALGRSSEGFYYQPSLKFYIPLGSTGSHALTLAGGARLMIEDLRSIRTLSFDDPWFMAEIGYNFNAGLINTNVFARYNGDFVIGLQLKLCHVFTPKQQ
jgi:hypothetical protein